MANLFAACQHNGRLLAKRVPLDSSVQEAMELMFASQEEEFRRVGNEEVPFDGGWKADENEVLVVQAPEDAAVFVEAVTANPISVPVIDTRNFVDEGIRGLFTKSEQSEKCIVLVQLFTAAQVLSRRFPLILRGDAFRQLREAAFAFGTKLECIIEDERIKFKSFANLRKIIGSMSEHLRAATDEEMRQFAQHDRIEVSDVEAFIELTDETTRKLVRAVDGAGTLDEYSAYSIVEAAASVGLELESKGDRIVLPMNRGDLKNVVRFLDDGLFEAALTKRRYVTNSKRPVP